MYNDETAPQIMNCTFAANTAGALGGGLFNTDTGGYDDQKPMSIINCILWDNADGAGEGLSAQTHGGPETICSSCIQGWVDSGAGTGNIGEDPLFRDPNGGDYQLEADSPCVDSGTSDGAPSSDLGGGGRPCAAGVDMGAFELCSAPVFLRGDCNGDGEISGQVTDAVFLLRYNFVGGSSPPCLASCDSDGDGKVAGSVTDAVYLLSFSFLGGPQPPEPYPECGPGTLSDAKLGCETPPEGCGSQ
jgi:hypothetical protein